MKNKFTYKWSKLFASKRFNAKNGTIKLDVIEQQELLDDSDMLEDSEISECCGAKIVFHDICNECKEQFKQWLKTQN